MAKLHISPEAQQDLQKIKKYIAIELENPAAATNTVSNITKAHTQAFRFSRYGITIIIKHIDLFRYDNYNNHIENFRCEVKNEEQTFRKRQSVQGFLR